MNNLQLQKKYSNAFKKIAVSKNGLSLNESITNVQNNISWLYDKSFSKFRFKFDEEHEIIAGGGNMVVVSNKIFNVNESGGLLDLLNPIGNIIHAASLIKDMVLEFTSGKFLNEKVLLGAAATAEFLAIASAIVAAISTAGAAGVAAHKLGSTSMAVGIGVGFLVGGIIQCVSVGKEVDTVGELYDEANKEENQTKFNSGVTHVIMGAVAILTGPFHFGHKMMERASNALNNVISKVAAKLNLAKLSVYAKLLTPNASTIGKAGAEKLEKELLTGIVSGYYKKRIAKSHVAHHYIASFLSFFIGGLIGLGASSIVGKGISLFINIFTSIEETTKQYTNALDKSTESIYTDLQSWDTWVFSGLKYTLITLITLIIKGIKFLIQSVLKMISKVAGFMKSIFTLVQEYTASIKETGTETDKTISKIITDSIDENSPEEEIEKSNLKSIEKQIVNKSNKYDIQDAVNKKMGTPNLQKLGNIIFDSNKAVDKGDYLVVTDIKTKKDFGVIRNEDGSYKFKESTNENLYYNKKNKMFITDFKIFLNEQKKEELMNEAKSKGIFADIFDVSSNFLDMVRAYAAGFTARTVARNLPKNELIILKDKMFKNLEVGLTDKQKEVWKKIKGMIDEEIQKGQITTMLELGKQMERYSGITFIK